MAAALQRQIALPAGPCFQDEAASAEAAIEHCNRCLAGKSAQERVRWALEHLPGRHIVTSSFGAQSAVMLHMTTAVQADIPVVLIDTGYLFPETYRFIDELHARLRLNLKVYRADTSPAWQEARHGQRWSKGVQGLDAYNQENKVAPMQRALKELAVGTWLSGVRRSQGASRTRTAFVERGGERWKVHPIADWNDRAIFEYLKKHALPYHPLWDKGYVSIGDVHTTKPLHEVDSIEQTRFFGLKRECGIHELEI